MSSRALLLGLRQIEEVGHLYYDITEIGLSEIVFFRVAVDVSETVIISSFYLEMPYFGVRIFQTESACYSVIKLILDGHVVLRHDFIRAVVKIDVVFAETHFLFLAQINSDLRSGLKEELETALLTPPSEVGEDRYLDVVYGAAVSLGRTRCGVDHRLVAQVEDVFFPSDFGIIDFGLHRTDCVEILFTDISERYAARDAAVHLLIYFRIETHIAEDVTAVDADAEVVTVLSHLCRGE